MPGLALLMLAAALSGAPSADAPPAADDLELHQPADIDDDDLRGPARPSDPRVLGAALLAEAAVHVAGTAALAVVAAVAAVVFAYPSLILGYCAAYGCIACGPGFGACLFGVPINTVLAAVQIPVGAVSGTLGSVGAWLGAMFLGGRRTPLLPLLRAALLGEMLGVAGAIGISAMLTAAAMSTSLASGYFWFSLISASDPLFRLAPVTSAGISVGLGGAAVGLFLLAPLLGTLVNVVGVLATAGLLGRVEARVGRPRTPDEDAFNLDVGSVPAP